MIEQNKTVDDMAHEYLRDMRGDKPNWQSEVIFDAGIIATFKAGHASRDTEVDTWKYRAINAANIAEERNGMVTKIQSQLTAANERANKLELQMQDDYYEEKLSAANARIAFLDDSVRECHRVYHEDMKSKDARIQKLSNLVRECLEIWKHLYGDFVEPEHQCEAKAVFTFVRRAETILSEDDKDAK